MLAASVLFYLMALDGVISQLDGIFLIAGLIAFFVFLLLDARRYARVASARRSENPGTDKGGLANRILLVLGGIALLALGANLMVEAAVFFAGRFGIDPVVIGLTVVAIGTSLPELAASLVGAFRKEIDMSIGNVLGSNLLNVLFVVGFVSIIRPLAVDIGSLAVHFPVMLGFTFFLLPLMWTSYRITRVEGGILVLGFLAYIGYVIYPYVA